MSHWPSQSHSSSSSGPRNVNSSTLLKTGLILVSLSLLAQSRHSQETVIPIKSINITLTLTKRWLFLHEKYYFTLCYSNYWFLLRCTPFVILQLDNNFTWIYFSQQYLCVNQRHIWAEFHPNNGRKEWERDIWHVTKYLYMWQFDINGKSLARSINVSMSLNQ